MTETAHIFIAVSLIIGYVIIGAMFTNTFLRRWWVEGQLFFGGLWPITMAAIFIYALISGTIKEMVRLSKGDESK